MLFVSLKMNIHKCFIRFFHTGISSLAVDKSSLSKLRKSTGFPMIKCKKALVQFDNDLKKAAAWLQEQAQKEGWDKATKLQSRPMSQGLIGMVTDGSRGALLEVNCETDFVARNSKFQKLVAAATNSFFQHCNQNTTENKVLLPKEALDSIQAASGGTVADLVATGVGQMGENMAARRAVFLQAPPGAVLGHYIHTAGPEFHPIDHCVFGKYGSLITYVRNSKEVGRDLSIQEVGRQLCQHVVGMNPSKLGDPADDTPCEKKDEESAMIFQEFLLDPSITCGDYIRQTGTHVQDFVRFECGEELPSV